MQDELIPGDIKRRWDLVKLGETLSFAEIRCLRWNEIRVRLLRIWRDEEAEGLIYRIREMTLSAPEAEDLARVVKELSETAESLSGSDQRKADRRLIRLAFALPPDLLSKYALADLAHRRRLRRAGAYKALKMLGVSADLAPQLVLRFQEKADQELLTLIARSPEAVCAVDAEFLLLHIGESYWRMRVIEALIRAGDGCGPDFSTAYPREFAHAAGRCRAAGCIPAIRRLISPADLELLRTVTWALGVLGDREGLSKVRKILEHELTA